MKGRARSSASFGAWSMTAVACGLNAVGMVLERFLEQLAPGIPSWPTLMGAAVGLALLATIALIRGRVPERVASYIFVLNNTAVVVVLWVTDRYYAIQSESWPPFQANKLGVMTVALLAPSLWAGLVSIASLAGAAVLEFLLAPRGTSARFGLAEPWTTAVFAVFAVVLLGQRLYWLRREQALAQRDTERSVLERLARVSMAVRDLANTPLQTIRLSSALLRARAPELATPIERIERATQRLAALGATFSKEAETVEREHPELSFDALATLRSEREGAARDRRLEALVEIEQSRDIYLKGRIALAANLVNGAILVAGLWGSVRPGVALSWLAVMAATVAVRAGYWGRHRRAAAPYDARRWLRIWTVGTGVTGAIWGIGGVALFPVHLVVRQALLLFVIGGMVAGASASMSSHRPGFLAFTLPALLPSIGRLLYERDRIHGSMALLLALFAAAMSIIARMAGNRMAEAVRLRLRNGLLVEELVAAREGLHHLNRELEHRVMRRTLELQQAISDRDRFIAMVAHELRAPLTGLTLNQELMEQLSRASDPSSRELERTRRASRTQLERMRRLVDDLQDVSRLAADQMRYQKRPVPLATVLTSTLEHMAMELQARGATVRVDVERELVGEWDANRIEQVFTNLVSNALKHGAPPFSITARRADGSAVIVVRDEGPGISPGDLERILQPFERGSSTGVQGLGLGLHIAERIVRAHQGTIRVESQPGKGAAFIVELPLISS
jgi:signal transduction histidine kinase